ncbi:MAG: outer membrane protein/protective antigen [Acidobacteria bacterium]|nr:outer membrane protein/protective antigen [Acidobacteriota bacterium]
MVAGLAVRNRYRQNHHVRSDASRSRQRMKPLKPRWAAIALVAAMQVLLWTPGSIAQESRADSIAKQQEDKSKGLRPEVQDRIEQFVAKMTQGGWFFSANPRGFYPYLDSVYSGGGLTLGAGYRGYYGDYAFGEVRGLYSFKNYKRIEGRTVSPNHAGGLLDFEATAGWMDATQIPYYGLGIDTFKEAEANFRLQETYVHAGVTLRPVSWFRLRAVSGYDRFIEKSGTGSSPSIEEVYGPETAPGLGIDPSYIHTEASLGIVWAPAEGYARRGGVYRLSIHDYRNVAGDLSSFQLSRGEVVQHFPFLRETWVLSLRGRMESVFDQDAEVPYFLLPWLGSGSSLRGYGTGRFRDRHSLLMSGEWRWIPSRYALDMALFCDAGTVGRRFKDLKLGDLKYDYGIGIRFHGPEVTPLRFDIAHGSEGWHFVISASAAF